MPPVKPEVCIVGNRLAVFMGADVAGLPAKPDRPGKTSGIPFRQCRMPSALPLHPDATLAEIAAAVAARVHRIGRARSCCAYVFVRSGLVYVLSEDHLMAHRWAIEHTAEWVGCYGGTPDLETLADDLRELLPLR